MHRLYFVIFFLLCGLIGPFPPSLVYAANGTGESQPAGDSARPLQLYGDDSVLVLLQYPYSYSDVFTLRWRMRDLGGTDGGAMLDPFSEGVSDQGRVVVGTASAGGVHLFFQSGTHVQWTKAGRSIQPCWGAGNGVPPLVVCAGAAPTLLYAVAPSPLATSTSQPTSKSGLRLLTGKSEEKLGLWVLGGNKWLSAGELPVSGSTRELKMVSSSRYLYLLEHTKHGWNMWRSVSLPPTTSPATAKTSPRIAAVEWEAFPVPSALNESQVGPDAVELLMLQDRMVLLIWRLLPGDPHRLNLEFIRQDGNRWMDAPQSLARDTNGRPLTFPVGKTEVASATGKVAVIWPVSPTTQQEDASRAAPRPSMFQLFLPDGQPAGPAVRLLDDVQDIAPAAHREEWLALLSSIVVTLVLVGLFTWRRDEIFNPLTPPTGFQLATRSRRLAGLLIDLVPAVILALFLVGQPTAEMIFRMFFIERQTWDSGLIVLSLAQKEALAQFEWLVCLVYSALCLVMETVLGTTLGKWFLKMRVCGQDFSPPDRKQLLLRNLLRFLEVNPLTFYLLLVILLLSRNRQRVGDLLARTLVVQVLDPSAKLPERKPATSPPLARKISASQGKGPDHE